MPEVACDTSSLQYLRQIGHLHVLPAVTDRVWIPPAVQAEIAQGKLRGVDLPNLPSLSWAAIRPPLGSPLLPRADELGQSESQVLALAIENPAIVAILDDGVAREVAQLLSLRFTGTLGVLLDAKSAGLIPIVAPMLDLLQARGFRISKATRAAVLRAAGESTGALAGCCTIAALVSTGHQSLGSTGSLSSARTPKTHSCTRRRGSLRTKRSSASTPSANSRSASERFAAR